jgi:hypothetical protein
LTFPHTAYSVSVCISPICSSLWEVPVFHQLLFCFHLPFRNGDWSGNRFRSYLDAEFSISSLGHYFSKFTHEILLFFIHFLLGELTSMMKLDHLFYVL